MQHRPWFSAQRARGQVVRCFRAGQVGAVVVIAADSVAPAAAVGVVIGGGGRLGVRQDVLVHGLQVLHHVAGARAGLIVHLLVADAADDFVAAQLDERAPGDGHVLARHAVRVGVHVGRGRGGVRVRRHRGAH